ncbi:MULTISPECIES: hypothetical protein [unclassified Streptomyces]|uniref:hypothetical protein n=1 Tax=unclassified Streptomyces TaxID=2593676 RepID=UPI0007DE31A2|nr:hypothetical protein [Streptomyces sp. SAT1]ANH92791.1 hypothetical protein A8713_17855 [Streptomyces sp. SAT1]
MTMTTPQNASGPDTPGPDTPGPGPAAQGPPARERTAAEQRRLAEEKKRERYVWYYLGYFLFGIHVVAFVMIYAVRHAK